MTVGEKTCLVVIKPEEGEEKKMILHKNRHDLMICRFLIQFTEQ